MAGYVSPIVIVFHLLVPAPAVETTTHLTAPCRYPVEGGGEEKQENERLHLRNFPEHIYKQTLVKFPVQIPEEKTRMKSR